MVRGEKSWTRIRLLAEVDAVFAHIEPNPLMCQAVHGNVRRALTKRFPYGVFYVIDAEDVVVIGVLHAARNPRLVRK